MMCDAHTAGKMVVESAQMLSTAHRMLDGTLMKKPSKSGKRMVNYYEHPDADLELQLYKAVHHNHPSTVWTRESDKNYVWHYEHFIALCDEFEFRFGKVHATRTKLERILKKLPNKITLTDTETPFRLAMAAYPQCIVEGNPVQSYRNFYVADKARFAKWNKARPAPEWWLKKVDEEHYNNMKQAMEA